MKNENYYNKIKRLIYKRFDALDVEDLGHKQCLFNKESRRIEISIFKQPGEVYYRNKFSEKICKYFSVDRVDFEIFLKMWIKDKFKIKIKVNKIYPLF